MATRRQTQLMKELRAALVAAGFSATKFTTGWHPHNKRRGSGTRHAGFLLEPAPGCGDHAKLTFMCPGPLLPWKMCGLSEKSDLRRRHLVWLKKYRAVLTASGFALVEECEKVFELPYLVWGPKQEAVATPAAGEDATARTRL